MTTNNIKNSNVKLMILSLLMALLILPLTLLAQGSGGGAGNSNSGSGPSDSAMDNTQDKDQLRDQDRTDQPTQDQIRDQKQDQECLLSDDCEPDQDRDQSRMQDSIVPDPVQAQDRLRDQDCIENEDCEPTQAQDRDRQQIYTPDELRTAIQTQQRLMLVEEESVGEQVQSIYRNQNQVRVAANALASTSDVLGPIGPAVSRIAKDFDDSVQATVHAEERIQNRSGLTRFFFGSDDDIVDDLDAQVVQNKQRVQELNQFINAWDGDSEVKAVLQEQIQNMEQEQTRLQQLVDDERDSKGLFGFFFGWL